jgi:hypothetical protein
MRRIGTIAGVAAALLLVGGIAVASIPDASGVIHGCRKNSDGQLRVIDSDLGQTCATGWTPLNWSQTGPQGPAGAAGVSGREVVRTALNVPANSYAAGEGFSLYAFCPSGKLVVGGGGEGAAPMLLQGSRPFGDPGGAWLMLFRAADTATAFPGLTLEAYAICVAAS